ncbi:Multiple EGF like domains 8 [Balamuthia mandrillaris]
MEGARWTVLLVIMMALLAVAAARGARYKNQTDEYVVTRSGDMWKWLERMEKINQRDFLGFSGDCTHEKDEDGASIFYCEACFGAKEAVFQLKSFVDDLLVEFDASNLDSILSASVPIPHICIGPCDFDVGGLGFRFFDDIGDFFDDVGDAIADVVDDAIDIICDLPDICTPDRLNMELALSLFMGPTTFVTSNIKDAFVEEVLDGLPDWAAAANDPPFPGNAELLGDVCLTLTVPLCELDFTVELTYADMVLSSFTASDWIGEALYDLIGEFTEAQCRRKSYRNKQEREFDVDPATGTVRVCTHVELPLLKDQQICIVLSDVIISGSGVHACLELVKGFSMDLGCLDLGEVSSCSEKNCEECMEDSNCGWCPPLNLCMSSAKSLTHPCSACPGGVFTEDKELVCGGNSETYEECVATFRSTDFRKDFEVSKEEFRLGPGKWMLWGDVEEAFDFLDDNEDGILELDEFCFFSAEEK